MKVTIDTKQLLQQLRPMVAEELARMGCVVSGNVLSVCVPDFTVFLQAYSRYLETVSRNTKCMPSGLVTWAIVKQVYVIVESETTHRRIGVTFGYNQEEKGFHYRYVRDE